MATVRYKFRAYPNVVQEKQIARILGCCRTVWNDALRFRDESYSNVEKRISGYDLKKIVITKAKQSPDREWLSFAPSMSLQQVVADQEKAWSKFFKWCKQGKKGRRVGPPRFKKRGAMRGFWLSRNGFKICSSRRRVKISKVGWIKIKMDRDLPDLPSSCTVIRDNLGHYYVSFVVERNLEHIPPSSPAVGIDLGVKTFAVLSNGSQVQRELPDLDKLEGKIRRAARSFSRKKKGSNRREKAKKKLAKLRKKQARVREDFQHKLSHELVSNYGSICIEDLAVSNMVKNRRLARVIQSQAWYQFRSMLTYKAEEQGRELHVVSRWEPTSQTCSSCGFRWGRLDLSVRKVCCEKCGTWHDRDENAAKNLEKFVAGSHSETLNARGESVRPQTEAVLVEARTHEIEKAVQLCLFS